LIYKGKKGKLKKSNSISKINDFQLNWNELWEQELFRKKTYEQIFKDFQLAGITIDILQLKNHFLIETLALEIEAHITNENISQLCYIVDLKNPFSEQLGLAILQRIAFKVYLRIHLPQ
jgi:hypothetical protein